VGHLKVEHIDSSFPKIPQANKSTKSRNSRRSFMSHKSHVKNQMIEIVKRKPYFFKPDTIKLQRPKVKKDPALEEFDRNIGNFIHSI